MKKPLCGLWVFLIGFVLPLAGFSEEPRRPKIGLVLSGGGARGTAHVGVLKVLDAMGVHVDCIAGTSMGSVVGGLYASGLSSEAIEKFLTTFDWTNGFKDSPSRQELSFRRKEDDTNFLVKLRVGVGRDGFKFPRGGVQWQNFITELRKVAGLWSNYESFDKLPIPFRAVAVDLVKGVPCVLASDDLTLAIRSSIAISPLFAPMEFQNKLLVDGGYLKNIPVDVARQMGAERLIVVNIGTPLDSAEGLKSVIDVLGQAARLGGTENDRIQLASLKKGDLLISPDLTGLKFADFDKIPDMIARGEQAALLLKKELQDFVNQNARPIVYKPPVRPVIHAIKIINGTRISDQTILAFITQKRGGPLDPDALQLDLSRVYGLGYFEYVDYRVDITKNGNLLVVNAPRKTWGPNYLNFGLQLSDEFNGNSEYGFLTRFQMTEMNSLGAEFKTDARIGTNPGVEAEFYQPLGRVPKHLSYGAPYFTSVGVSYGQKNLNFLVPSLGQFPFRSKTSGMSLAGGRTVLNWGQLKGGLDLRDESFRSRSLENIFSETTKKRYREVFARASVDTLGHPAFPAHGIMGYVDTRVSSPEMGASGSYTTFDTKWIAAIQKGRNIFRWKGIYSDILSGDQNNAPGYELGGFLNLGGYSQDALGGGQRELLQGQYAFQRGRVGKLPIWWGVVGEWGGVGSQHKSLTLNNGVFSGTFYGALDTVLGPCYLAYSRAENAVSAVYLFLGQTF